MGINKPKRLEERKESLRHWRNTNKHDFNIDEFADAGFFFEKSDLHDDPGRLRCAYCPAVIGNWQPEDDPWVEHALSVDHCPHVVFHKGMEFVERLKNEEEELAESSYDIDDFMAQDQMNYELLPEQNSFGLFGLPMMSMSREQKFSTNSNSEQHLGGIVQSNCMEHHEREQGVSGRHMDSKETRLASFDTVRHLLDDDTLNQMVESGLYLEGIDAHGIKSRCYSCSCVLSDICEEDDLWTVHAQISECAHVMKVKGQDFIQNARGTDKGVKQESMSSSGGSARTSCKQQFLQGRENDTKSQNTRRPFQNKKHDAYTAGRGLKRRQRFYNYEGRWWPIKWRPLLKHRFFRGNLNWGGGTHTDDVVFLCCKLKVYSRSGGQYPCPHCFQNKHV